MPILPSGGGYPGIIGEAELIASAVASVAADKAASTAAAADALSARTAAQSDAGLALSARNAAQSDAGLALNARESAASAAADVSAAKAQAEAAAGTIAGLVPGAQQDAANVADAWALAAADAGTVAALVTPAQADAQTIADLVAPAQADASAVSGYSATAAAAVANMEVAPLNSVASSSQVVRGSDPRLGLRGGAACTAGGATTATAFTPVAPFALTTLGLEVSPLASASAVRVLWSTGTGNTTSDLRLKIATDGKLLFDEGNGSGFTSSTAYAAAGARWIWCVYNATANTIDVYADSSDTPVWTYSRINATALNAITYIGGTGSTTGYTGTVRAVCALNFAATQADRIAAMRGEYPAKWKNGAVGTNFTKYSGGGTRVGNVITTATNDTTNVGIGASADGVANSLNVLAGQTLRVRLSTSAPFIRCNLMTAVGTVLSSSNVGVNVAAGGAITLEYAISTSQLTAGAYIYFQARDTDGTTVISADIALIDWTLLGAQLLVGPQDWTRTRGVDMSGNCNDLIYGTGVVAIEPATKARVIQATAAGATVSAGAVATVGTLSGATYSDTKAIAALRQWDAVSANWRQARPANCAALQAAVTANGTPLVEATALASGSCPVSANAPINLIHTIN